MINTGDIFIAKHGFLYGIRIDEIFSNNVDDDGYVPMNVTFCDVETMPPLPRRNSKTTMHLKVITQDLIRDFEPQEYGYPGEAGLLPMYLVKYVKSNEQLHLF